VSVEPGSATSAVGSLNEQPAIKEIKFNGGAGSASSRSGPHRDTDIESTQGDCVSPWTSFFLSIACGLLAANIYYAQPIAGPISAALGLAPNATGLIVTSTQIGYVAGLLLLVPLGDLVENRRLLMLLTAGAALALLNEAFATHPWHFFASAFFVGFGSAAVQIMLPYATHMVSPRARGRFIGNIMSGLMIGIMLARPASSLIAELTNWRVVFLFSGFVALSLSIAISLVLPRRVPVTKLGYVALLASMAHLALSTPVLRRRTFYQIWLFASFSMFWTTVPLLLAEPTFGFSQGGIALFGLAGGAGAIAAPLAGQLADRGLTRPATALSMIAVASAFLVARTIREGTPMAIAVLVAAALFIDFGMTANLTLGQRAIFLLGAEFRSRFNAIYLAAYFVGGAVGSAIGGWAYATGGWILTCSIGLSFPVVGLLYFLTESRDKSMSSSRERAQSSSGRTDIGSA
jgi:predicted MFS family arabinose efflux permease